MGRPSVGEGPPEVTLPMTLPASSVISAPSRAGAPVTNRPTRLRFRPPVSSSMIRAAPGKSRASLRRLFTAKFRPASIGEVVVSMSWP